MLASIFEEANRTHQPRKSIENPLFYFSFYQPYAKENIKLIQLSFVNSLFVKADEGFVLVDTGCPASGKKLEKILISAGCLPDRLKLVILTHGDSDHAGNGKKLQEKYKAKIAMHRDDYAIIETGFSGKRTVKSLTMRIVFRLFSFLRKLRKSKINPNRFAPDIFLQDGQTWGIWTECPALSISRATPRVPSPFYGSGDLFAGEPLVNTQEAGNSDNHRKSSST